ncbi:MAG: hypothetical protein P0Y49_06580 [Candidatus Pedobacter colombiensis]|uniref:Uncharacterized protein n=1 Tax=Candidatus Pedobacter colombiensis TaxID=3121371 RepID=A0AAJ5WA94_9SPHI|nr:hypothetical protein [Pedobacter sp.]WEK20799.1 MAG: hypothetical protein P0Y49_06580 [Pedobacter sp.]
MDKYSVVKNDTKLPLKACNETIYKEQKIHRKRIEIIEVQRSMVVGALTGHSWGVAGALTGP